MLWAKQNGFVVFTHDLDFGAILAATQADSPSVFQVRTQDVAPESIGPLVIAALAQFEEMLSKGALVTVDRNKARVRTLPLR